MNLQGMFATETLTARDFAFVAETLAEHPNDREGVRRLMADTAEALRLLDEPTLADRIALRDGLTEVSSALFWYLLVRRRLRAAGIEDRSLADYVAAVLDRFLEGSAWRTAPGHTGHIDYEFDLLVALAEAPRQLQCAMHAYGGDRNLFLTGLHAAHLRRQKHRRGAPGVRYYESAGQAHYRQARDCAPPSAQMRDTFDLLAETFPKVRAELNYLAEEYLN